jgi:bifunctional non-homologous end joining protein LigD
VKFDGWRVQLHKHEGAIAVYSRKGFDLTRRLPSITLALNELSVRSAIFDGELVALDDKGLPNFEALHFRRPHAPLCVFAFDILHLNGCDLRPIPLSVRKDNC